MISADFLIDNADLIATCAGPAPRAGRAQGDIAPVTQGSIASLDGRIVFVGREEDCRHDVSLRPHATVLDGRGRTIVPGFVDSHTHLVFAGDRRDELGRRLAGATYAEIAASGGGIVRTVAATREASEAALAEAARPRLAAMLAHGTTTAEVKSGYGLDLESELKTLRVIRRLAGEQAMTLAATFAGSIRPSTAIAATPAWTLSPTR
ncbi:MAG: amidohydrolase family protein [Vicinamibacterales bacterium]